MLADNLMKVQQGINAALTARTEEKLTGKNVTLVGVTKNHPPEIVEQAMALGITDLGENRVQEAMEKYNEATRSAKWHLIGHLQTNKVKQAVKLFDIIESADSEKILEALDKAAGVMGKRQDILLQLNLACEAQKSGFLAEAYAAVLPKLVTYKHLRVRGLMVIARQAEEQEETRQVFREGYQKFCDLREYLHSDEVDILSMGMTHDYRVAIEEGANSVRIGTALFGVRDYGRE